MGSWNSDPIPLGDKYRKVAFSADISTPVENGKLTITQSYGLRFLAYTAGQSVRVSKAADPSTYFEAIVESYDGATYTIVLSDITSVNGSTWGASNYTINLVGERGSKITSGSGAPSSSAGRVGDIYIDTVTGEVYIKQ
jgi:hypothetical protein